MKKTVQKIQNFKQEGKKITVLTSYDCSTARYADEVGTDIILVGDSLAQVILGYENTIDIGMEEMIIFTRAVSRGVKDALVVADMPFMSFQADKTQTIINACKLIKAGANAVKIEGCSDLLLETIKHLTESGIPVMGHLGFTPMSINAFGGHKIQGKNVQRTLEIREQALKLQNAGCFAVVLEMVPEESAKFIGQKLLIPTIGIGAGRFCDGQVLVIDDILGKFDRFTPKFARKYSNLKDTIISSVQKYCKDVEEGNFPNEDEIFKLDVEEIKKLENYNDR